MIKRLSCVLLVLMLLASALYDCRSASTGAGTQGSPSETGLATQGSTWADTAATAGTRAPETDAPAATAPIRGLGRPLAKLPGYAGGTLSPEYACGGGYYQVIISNTTQAQFDHYCLTLQQNGFTRYAGCTMSNNYFATYVQGALMAHLYLTAYSSQVRIIAAENVRLPALRAASYTKVKEASFTLFGLEKGGDDGGLGCMFQFEDGSFFIVDGGHDTAAEARDICDKLRALAPDKNHIVIRAWLITHAHGDHYGALVRFAQTYGSVSAIRIESFVFNFCDTAEQTRYLSDRGGSMNTVKSTVTRYYPGAGVFKPLTGQTFHYAGAEMEVLYCVSDFLPQTIGTETADADKTNADGNIQTVVFRMRIAGQTVLVTGDAAKVCVDEMSARYGHYLKSNMMTVPHHGWNENRYRARNGTVQFYTLVDPSVVFWPDGVKAQKKKLKWNGKAGGDWEANDYLRNRLHVRECLVAGSTTRTVVLPYTP